jgi:hypothetical protein
LFNFKDGFQTTDIIYHWGMKNGSQDSSALTIDSSIELPQFTYKKYKLIERKFNTSTGQSHFNLKLDFKKIFS